MILPRISALKSLIALSIIAITLSACGPQGAPSYSPAYAAAPAFDASGVPLPQQMAQPQDRGFLSEHGDALLGAGAGYMLGRAGANSANRGGNTTIIQQHAPSYTTVAPAQRYYGSRPLTTSSDRGLFSRSPGITRSTSPSGITTRSTISSSGRTSVRVGRR